MKNTMAKTRPLSNPYEVWMNNSGWTWKVLKKWQADDNKPYARWFCHVTSPMCMEGEMGDCYAKDIIQNAIKVISNQILVTDIRIPGLEELNDQPHLTRAQITILVDIMEDKEA